MNAYAGIIDTAPAQDAAVFPFDLRWSSQDLADAVPLRLHELFAFDASREVTDHTSANQVAGRRRPARTGYIDGEGFTRLFRVG